MSGPSFANRYRSGLLRFVEERSERRLRTAYELGRAAVQADLGLLDVAAEHNLALVEVVTAADPADVADAVAAAGDFLVESLAAYEMVQRGVTDARRAAFEERRRGRMLRELSSVLADSSVAYTARESVGELAQLVAEIAREATEAGAARLVLHTPRGAGEIEATASEPEADTWSELLPPSSSGRRSEAPHGPTEVVNVTIRTLEGRPIGSLEVSAADARRFGRDDRATVVQIAQMTAAWLERAHWQRP